MKTISIINIKGGVGKTTSAVTVAHILAIRHKKRVLLVDNDKQGNASDMLGVDGGEYTLASLVTDESLSPAAAVCTTEYENLSLILSDESLVHAASDMEARPDWPVETRLRDALKKIEDDFDYCIIDNAPQLDMLVINALLASDEVWIPAKVDAFSLSGIEMTLEVVAQVQQMRPELTVAGVILTHYQPRTRICQQGIEAVEEASEVPVLQPPIRHSIKVSESTFTKPLTQHAPRCTAAQDYLLWVDGYMKRQKKKQK